MSKKKWMFVAYKTQQAASNNKPYFSRVFHDHTEMKEFSAEHSKEKQLHPDYCSDYWDV